MPEFKSPLGTRNIGGQPIRDFTVSDESRFTQQPPQIRQQRFEVPNIDPGAMQDFEQRFNQPQTQQTRDLSETEQQFMAAKRAKREGKERLTEGARRRVEMLIGMTRLTREIEIGGNQYRLQSLSSRELRDAISATAEFDGSVQFIFETRKQLLARSLVIIAGVETAQFLHSSELEVRLDFIEEMDHALLLRLYQEYNLMAKEAQDKYAIKTQEEVKGVIADLGK